MPQQRNNPSNGYSSEIVSWLIALGAIMLFIGILLTLYFTFVFGTFVQAGENNVVNFNLVQDRIVGIMISLTTTFFGFFSVVMALIAHLLSTIVVVLTRR